MYLLRTTRHLSEIYDLRLLPYFPHGVDIDLLPEIQFVSFGRSDKAEPVVYMVPQDDTLIGSQMVELGYPMLPSSSPTLDDLFQIACKTEGAVGKFCFTLTSRSGDDIVEKKFDMTTDCRTMYGDYLLHDLGLSGPTVCAFIGPPVSTILVMTLTAQRIAVSCASGDTVDRIKSLIREKKGIPADQQRLIFSGLELEDHRTLSYYRIPNKSMLYLVSKLRGGMFHPSSARTDMEELKSPEKRKMAIHFDYGHTDDVVVDTDHAYEVIKDLAKNSLRRFSRSEDSISSKQRLVKRLRAALKEAEEDLSKHIKNKRREPSEDCLMALLQEEATMRNSKEIQDLMEKAENTAESDCKSVVVVSRLTIMCQGWTW
jgi:Ubiquitin family